MKIISIFLLLFTFDVFADPISFQTPAPKPGQTFVRTSTYKMDIDVVLKFAGESLSEQKQIWTETVRKRETILQVSDDAITRLKVTYETVNEKVVITEDGIQEDKKVDPSPVVGRTYVVSVENGKLKVQDSSGYNPNPNEVEIVEADYEGLGKPDAFLEFFKQRTVQVGEPLQMPGFLAEGMFTDAHRRQVKVDNATFVLMTIRENQATFDTGLKMKWNHDANTSIKMNLQGETVVGIQSSRLVSSNLSGTVRVTGVEQLYNRLVMVDGNGRMTLTESIQLR